MFIAKNNDLIILANNNKEELEQALQFMVYTSIEETDIEYLLYNGEYLTPDKVEEKERQRLDSLTLTPSDVERALYYGLGMDFDDLKNLIAQQAPQIDLKALAIEFRANNFYRGATDKGGNRIVDMIGLILGYTSDDMDYLFENKELPEKEEEPELDNLEESEEL